MKEYTEPHEPSIEEIENELFMGRWREEAKQLPLKYLSPQEQALIQRYINNGILSPDEEEQVKEILEQYRPALMKIKPAETIENAEKNAQYIEDEKAFLELIDATSEIQVIPFTFMKGEKTYRMKFDLYPLTDSQAITDITSNLSMFQDLTEDELITYNKIQHGETLTREEILLRASVEEKIQQATTQNTRRTVIEYLAMQLKFHGKDSSQEVMKQTFSRIPDVYLSLLFDEVQERNHISDLKAEKVFQPFD